MSALKLLTQPSSIAGYGIIFAGIQALVAKDWLTGIGLILSGVGAVLVPEGTRK